MYWPANDKSLNPFWLTTAALFLSAELLIYDE